MGQNLAVTVSPSGTLTLDSAWRAIAICTTGTNPFYFSVSPTATAPTASATTGSWVGGNILAFRDGSGVRSMQFLMVDTTQSMTAYAAPLIPSSAGS